MRKKWTKAFWMDLGERVGSTFLGALLTLITMDNVLEGPDWNTSLWPIVVVPTLFSAIKGLMANMATPASGASILSTPPGPVIDERGQGNVISLTMIVLVVLLIIYLLSLIF